MFLPTFSTNLFYCQGFKHTKDKRIQKISSLHLLEITAVLREAMTSLNETLLLFFLLKRQIWHINTELQTHQRRTATRWRNCSLNGTSGGKSHLKSYKTKLTWQRLSSCLPPSYHWYIKSIFSKAAPELYLITRVFSHSLSNNNSYLVFMATSPLRTILKQ